MSVRFVIRLSVIGFGVSYTFRPIAAIYASLTDHRRHHIVVHRLVLFAQHHVIVIQNISHNP